MILLNCNRLKRTISILLLAVVLFNVGGYYLFFWGLRTHASMELMRQLDAESYSLNETIELKIPISLPYPLQENGYERINGAFEYKNQQYKLVKQKMEGDTLFVVCIKDHKEEKLQHAMTDYAKVSNDLPSASKEKLNLMSKLLKEYNSQFPVAIINELSGWCVISRNCYHSTKINSVDQPIFSPPPKSFY